MDMALSIGELSRMTGVPVKTIRFYSDTGLLPESSRTAAGYRRYDETCLARLELVRALRDLGVDLRTIQRVADRHTTIQEAARVQADATDLRIRQLILRRGVLRAIARREAGPKEVQLMTAFANASADESRRIMEEFLDAVFADHDDNPFAARMRTGLPDLPEEPTDVQVDAWVELAQLVQDASFRARIREMIVEGERQRAAPGSGEIDAATRRAGQAVFERAGAAVRNATAPTSPEAQPIVDDLAAQFAAAAGKADDPEYRQELLRQLMTFSDSRVERYWQLIGVINGWPPQPSLAPAYEWLIAALQR